MTLTRRLILVVAGSIALAVLSTSLVFGWLGHNALIHQAEGQSRAIARIVAESARLSELSFEEMHNILIDDLATLAFAVGRSQNISGEFGVEHLSKVTARGNLASLWLVDEKLNVTASSVGTYGTLMSGERLPDDLPRPALLSLASGERFSLPLGGPVSGIQYVGVHVEGGGLLIAGQPVSVLDAAQAANSLPVLLAALLNKDEIEAIQVFDDTQTPIASVGVPLQADMVLSLAAATIAGAGAVSDLTLDRLLVSAPIRDIAGITIGTVVTAMSTQPLEAMLLDNLLYGVLTSGAVFAAGFAGAAIFARRIARPVAAMTRAAEEVDMRAFDPASLDGLVGQRDELGTLARVFQHMAIDIQAREEHLEGLVRARTLELEQKNDLLEESKYRVETELDAARSLQAAILPQDIPVHEAYTGKAIMIPARELGGDFYDFFAIDDRHLGIVIADVSGKGVPAAFFMAISRTVLQASARENRAPGACLESANTILCAQNPMSMFVTTFYGILDTETGMLTYANGGHNSPLMLRRSEGGVSDLPRTGGMALGVMPDMPYAEKSIQLDAGDTLFLYTDGISEAMDRKGSEFTELRLREALGEAHMLGIDLVIKRVTDAVEGFVSGAEQSDDITCLVVRYAGNNQPDRGF